ncbi:hypothetical protein CK203_103977 [Vitis vinifera]|uniref:Uncharacterized protein n=1 Tax=Vitis vinifera TaxID=29760 RepID=A0A438CZ62_VITVI|nr:hypothetical protein CK203_103977 [Vitis vinifera]
MPSCRYNDWIKNLYELKSRVHPSGNYVDHRRLEVSTLAPSVGNFYFDSVTKKDGYTFPKPFIWWGEDDDLNGASHRKETVGKRKTAESSPPGDRKIERRKRCVTHPGFTSGPLDVSVRGAKPHEPRTPMPRAPREESSDSTHFSAKRQRDKKSQLSNSMRARLGPQEPGRSRPPMPQLGTTP